MGRSPAESRGARGPGVASGVPPSEAEIAAFSPRRCAREQPQAAAHATAFDRRTAVPRFDALHRGSAACESLRSQPTRFSSACRPTASASTSAPRGRACGRRCRPSRNDPHRLRRLCRRRPCRNVRRHGRPTPSARSCGDMSAPSANSCATVCANWSPFPLDTPLPLLEWGTNYVIATRLFCYLLLHAGVVERGGRAIVMPALPGSGKSTLTAALTLRGFRLLSDEFGVVRLGDARLLRMLRPLALKNESIDVIATVRAECRHWSALSEDPQGNRRTPRAAGRRTSMRGTKRQSGPRGVSPLRPNRRHRARAGEQDPCIRAASRQLVQLPRARPGRIRRARPTRRREFVLAASLQRPRRRNQGARRPARRNGPDRRMRCQLRRTRRRSPEERLHDRRRQRAINARTAPAGATAARGTRGPSFLRQLRRVALGSRHSARAQRAPAGRAGAPACTRTSIGQRCPTACSATSTPD